MALRFTNTDKWSDCWFTELTPIQKLLFIYLCDNCDIAGFIELNYKKWAYDIGVKKEIIQGATEGLGRGLILSDTGDCIYIKNFLKHQKNLPLNDKNNAHVGIFKRFDLYSSKFGITDIYSFIEAPSKGLTSPIGKGNDKGISKGKRQNSEKIPTIEEVKEFFKSNGYNPKFGETRWHYYNDNNWHDSKGNKVLSWKQKMRAVWFKDENKIKNTNNGQEYEYLKRK